MSKVLRVHLSLFLVSLIYGATFTIAKEVMPKYVQPFGLIFIRVAGATVLLWITHALFIKDEITDRKDFGRLLICSVVGVAANMLLFFKGLSQTTPINGAVIMVMTPLFVGVFAFIILREKVTIRKLIGLVLGLGGATLLLSGGRLSFHSETVAGDTMVMINAIIYSYYLIIVKPLIQKHYPLTIIKWIFLFGTFLVLPFGWNELRAVEWSTVPGTIYFSILFLVAGATYLTYLLNGWALRYVNSSVVGAYVYLQPILASFIAVAFDKDQLTTEKVWFSLMIFWGVYLVSFPKSLFPVVSKVVKRMAKR